MKCKIKITAFVAILALSVAGILVFSKKENRISQNQFVGQWVSFSKDNNIRDGFEFPTIARNLIIDEQGEVILKIVSDGKIMTYMGKIEKYSDRRAEAAILWGPILEHKSKDAAAARLFMEEDSGKMKVRFTNREEYIYSRQ